LKLVPLPYEHDVGITDIVFGPAYSMKQEEWFTYGGENADAIGRIGGGTFEGAIRMTPDELEPFDGCRVTSMKYCHGILSGAGEPATDGYMKIYGPGTASSPGDLLVSEPFHTPAGNAWFQFYFSNWVYVDASQDMWFSVEVDDQPVGAFPLGVDAGPAVDEKGDWAGIDGTWNELQIYGLDYNWNHMVGFEGPIPPCFPAGTYYIDGKVKNFGVATESNIPVNEKITNLDNGSIVYDQNITIPGPLAPGDTILTNFPSVTFYNQPSRVGDYKVEIKTMLLGDEHPGNDKKSLIFLIYHAGIPPPVTNHTIIGIVGNNNWYVSSVTIMLRAIQPPGPPRNLTVDTQQTGGTIVTFYKIHSSESWTEYQWPLTIDSDDSSYNLSYYSINEYGEMEQPKGPFPFKIDKIPPIITLTAAVEDPVNPVWALNASVADAMSGVAKVDFYVNDIFIGNVSSPGPYVWQYEGNGTTAQAIVYDNAGNSIASPYVRCLDLLVQAHSEALLVSKLCADDTHMTMLTFPVVSRHL